MLKLGTENISGLYVGEQKIKKAFVGEQLVFEENTGYTVYFYAIEGTDTGKILNSSSWTVNPGESVTVYPWSIDGYKFDGWYEGNTLLSTVDGEFVYTPTKAVTTIYLRYSVGYAIWGVLNSEGPESAIIYINDVPHTITKTQEALAYAAPGASVKIEYKNSVDGYSFEQWYVTWSGATGSPTTTSNPYTFTMPSKLVPCILYLKKQRLPAGYTELEYVQSQNRTSTASYVGCFYYLKPTGATAMRVTFSFGVALSGTAYQPIIGDLKYVNNNRRSFGLWANANGIFAMRDFSNIDTLSTSLSVGAKYTYETGCSPSVYTKWYVNESLVNTLTTGISTTFYSRSFGTIGGALSVVYNTVSSNSGLSNITYTMPRGIRLHSVQYLNADGDILLDLVPARNSSGIVGLYDTIANKFYQQSKGGIALNTATLNSDGKINANTPSANYQITAGPAV